MGQGMSDRDDDGFMSPEGKGMSEEEQRRKAALAQLTVDSGAAEDNSDESGPPKAIDLKTTIEKEKEAEDHNVLVAKLRSKVENMGHLEAFSHDGEGLKPTTNVDTFDKDHKSNALEFERYAKRILQAIQEANKKVVNLSGYLSINGGAASARHEAPALFEKE